MKCIVEVLKCNTPTNYTGRIYQSSDVEEAAAAYMKGNMLYGILVEGIPLPDDKQIEEFISIADISHIVHTMYMHNDMLYAEIELLDTPKGQTAQELFDYLRISPAIWGTVDPITNVVSDVDILYTRLVPKNTIIKKET